VRAIYVAHADARVGPLEAFFLQKRTKVVAQGAGEERQDEQVSEL
jgi:hypothetical protein